MILSGNSVAHLQVMLGAFTAGVPIMPVSVAYSLMGKDHERIRAIAELTRPGLVFAEDGSVRAGARRAGAARGPLFPRTVSALRDVAPTVYFNVPAGFALLAPALEADRELAAHFFSRLRFMFCAAAALPDELAVRLLALAQEVADYPVPSRRAGVRRRRLRPRRPRISRMP
jgi:hypothetical protein